MAKGDHGFKKKPEGSTNGGYRRPRVQIGFDEDQIKAISQWAKYNHHSFAAGVRELVARGLRSLTR